MKVTNKYNLPEPLVRAVTYDMKPRKGFSVTDLIQSPRMLQLTRRHWDELEVDASERIWVLMGQAIHYILALYYAEGALKEHRLKTEVDGTEVTGRSDLWECPVLDDYKITSAWSIVFEPQGRDDWHKQLNIYRWMHHLEGRESDLLRDIALLRDWQQNKRGERNYPPIPVAVIEVPVWTYEETEQYVKDRVKLHKKAIKLADDDLPPCTDEEMWAKPTTYAVMREGRKTALRVFEDYDRAAMYIAPKQHIETRPGKRVRCEGYCDVRQFCSQYKQYKEA